MKGGRIELTSGIEVLERGKTVGHCVLVAIRRLWLSKLLMCVALEFREVGLMTLVDGSGRHSWSLTGSTYLGSRRGESILPGGVARKR